MTAFDQCFDLVVGFEGAELSLESYDSGNWTGGKCGSGILRGSRFGISAAAYPDVDIAALTSDGAKALYQRDYWAPIQGDALPLPVAMLLFDSAVNNGVPRASRWLQAAVGVTVDSVIGPHTIAAVNTVVHQHGGAAVCVEFMARRTAFMGGLDTWSAFGLGWSRRLAALPYQAMRLAQGASP